MVDDDDGSVEDLIDRITKLSSEERAELFETLDRARLEEYLEIRAKYVERLESEPEDRFPEESLLADYCRDHPDDPFCRSFGTDAQERRRELHEEFVAELQDSGLMDVEARLMASHSPISDPRTPPAWEASDLDRTPLGFIDWPGRDFDLPDEPRSRPPSDPFFGTDACGRAARTVWEARVGPLGPSWAAHEDAQLFASNCRNQIPNYPGRCSAAMRFGWADCYAREYIRLRNRRASSACEQAARFAKRRCEAFQLPLPDYRDWP